MHHPSLKHSLAIESKANPCFIILNFILVFRFFHLEMNSARSFDQSVMCNAFVLKYHPLINNVLYLVCLVDSAMLYIHYLCLKVLQSLIEIRFFQSSSQVFKIYYREEGIYFLLAKENIRRYFLLNPRCFIFRKM